MLETMLVLPLESCSLAKRWGIRMHRAGLSLSVLFCVMITGIVAGHAFADKCDSSHRSFPQSYIGVGKADPSAPDVVDLKWFSRIAIGENNIVKYSGGPIWDGDSTANDDANYLDDILPGTRKTEYETLGWAHPVNLAVSGDYVPSILYRLYAMEQKLNLNTNEPPRMLERDSENVLFKVKAPFMVLHVGTNELYKTESAPDIVSDIEALVCELHHDLPLVSKIVVVSIYPRGPFFGLDVAKRIQINVALSTAAATNQYPFVFVDATNYLETLCTGHFDSKGQCSYFKDLTHPKAPAAYGVDQLIAKVVKQ